MISEVSPDEFFLESHKREICTIYKVHVEHTEKCNSTTKKDVFLANLSRNLLAQISDH